MAKETIKISTLLGHGSVCDGDFRCSGSTRIDGEVNGNVEIDGTLILGTIGKVNGDIHAKCVQIGGEVVGDVYAPDRAELTATAKVIGNLSTNVIVIDENAVFQGLINMNQEVPERKNRGFAFKKALKEGQKSAAAAVAEALREAEAEEKEEIPTETV